MEQEEKIMIYSNCIPPPTKKKSCKETPITARKSDNSQWISNLKKKKCFQKINFTNFQHVTIRTMNIKCFQ